MTAILEHKKQILTALGIVVLLIVGLWIRNSVLSAEDQFRNEDVAGITYNADLLRAGKVPLVDSHELKAPAAFFATWMVWAVTERSMVALETFGVIWALLTALGVMVAGRVMYGPLAGFLAGLIYVIFSPITDSLTVNYNTWMLLPYVWATAFFVLGLKRGHWCWFLAAGAVTTVSALFKHQGGAIGPLFVLIAIVATPAFQPRGWAHIARTKAVSALIGGAILGAVPLVTFYLLRGGLLAALKTFFMSEWGWRYVEGELSWDAKMDRLEDGLLGFFEFMAVPTVLCVMALATIALRRNRPYSTRSVLLGGHFFLSFISVAVGFRFFTGYYLQILPACAWIAAHPDGPLLRWATALYRWPWALSGRLLRVAHLGFLISLLLVPLALDLPDLRRVRKYRNQFNDYQHEAKRIGLFVKKHSRPQDTIWVWGRWAWPIYYFADRLSPISEYKVLGMITTNLTNTWKRPTEMTRFVKVGPWREIGAGLTKHKPRYIVAAVNESYDGFDPLIKLLADHYEPVPDFSPRAFRFYRRKDEKNAKDHVRDPGIEDPGTTHTHGIGPMRFDSERLIRPPRLQRTNAIRRLPSIIKPHKTAPKTK